VSPQSNILNQKFEREVVLQSARANDIDPQHVANLIADNVLSEDTYEYCERHGSAIEACGCNSGTTRTELSINGQYLINRWVGWIRSTDIFREISSNQIASQRWEVTAKYNQKNLKFQLFFDFDDLKSYSVEPFSLEFGFSFLSDQYLPEESTILPWYDPLGDLNQFSERIDDLIKEYTELISASFVDKDDVQGFRRKVRNEIRDYLIGQGYEPVREVSECRGTSKYDISPEGDDLLMRREGNQVEEILVCRCPTGKGYHLHRFVDNQIVTVDADDEYSHLLDHIENNIDDYVEIQQAKNRSTNTTNVLATLSAALSSLVFIDGLLNITGTFSRYFPEALSSAWLQTVLFILSLGLLVILVVIILKPYIDDRQFEWDVPEYDVS
jgi:hypothetical protein